ncbi:MAG: hypothetical protein WCT49_02940 [Candidatus Paceibacterota bacterium]|jgi:hypothetical protein|nr:hypothetical protein [Candidatus Paceibacterota bacterium]
MLKFIENLRSAPDETKKTFATAISAVLTLIIVLSTYAISDPLFVKAEKKDAQSADALPSPFAVLSSQIGHSFAELKKDFSSIPIKQVIGSLSTKGTSTETAIAPAKASTTVEVATSTKPAAVKVSSSTPAAATLAKPPKAKATTEVKTKPKVYGPAPIPGYKKPAATTASVLTIGTTAPTLDDIPKSEPRPETPPPTDIPTPSVPDPDPSILPPTAPEPPKLDTSPLYQTTQSLWPKTFTSGSSN